MTAGLVPQHSPEGVMDRNKRNKRERTKYVQIGSPTG